MSTSTTMPRNIIFVIRYLKGPAMIIPLVALLFFYAPVWSMDTPEPENYSTSTVLRAPENKAFSNLRVYNTTHTKDLYVEDNTVIGGKLTVNGSIVGAGNVNGPDSSTQNALALFADASGKVLKNSPIIISDTGNVAGVVNLTATTVTAPALNGTATNALFVGSQSASNVTAATVLALTATSDNFYNMIVRRDNFGNFVTTMITLTSDPSNATDAATKRYVDTTAGSGIVTKTPVRATSTSNVASLSGPQTIDDVLLIAGDRVLLTEQSTPTENGLWEVRAGAWAPRPSDFAAGDPAGTAYVLTTSGTLYAGSGWICITPTAIIDTNPLTFVQFSSPGSVTGQNVGVGTGTLFKDKTGNLINFKTLVAGDNMIITNNSSGNDITLTASALSENIPNTIVLRDSFGNFSAGTITAALTGTASENVLRTGDTMTGTLTLIAGLTTNPSLQFAGSTNTGLSAETPNKLSFSTNGAECMSIDAVGTVSINQFTVAGVMHNDSAGALSSSLILNADISNSAQISDTKLATISTPGKVLDSATTATSDNIANTIVRRNSSGDFSANVITAASIIGAAADNVLRAGDSMTGTFTVIAGSAAQPSLQFVGSSHTGLSAAIPDTLVFSTDGVERMSINETGTVTISGNLVLAPGSIAQPSLQFTNGSNTGISSPIPDRLSFDVNGVERMFIDATSVTMIGGAVVFGNVMSINSTQTVGLSGLGNNVTINDGISTLIVVYTDPTEIDTLTLPSSPIAGQLVTIKALRLANGNLDINAYSPAFDPASEAIIQLSPNANLAGNAGGASVTYIYLTEAMGAPADGWFRYGRG